MGQLIISPEIKAILRNAELTDTYVQLNQQLGKMYKEVNAVLEAAGGRWNSKEGRHNFEFANPKLVLLPLINSEGEGSLSVFTVIGLWPDGRRYCNVLSAKDALAAQEAAEEEADGGSGSMDRVLLVAAVIAGAHTNVAAPALISNGGAF